MEVVRSASVHISSPGAQAGSPARPCCQSWSARLPDAGGESVVCEGGVAVQQNAGIVVSLSDNSIQGPQLALPA